MTQEEHLNKIVAKCRELLAGAEKRKAGKWTYANRGTYSDIIAPDDLCGGVYLATVCGFSVGDQEVNRGIHNSAFIANCAGPAEAGWRATIAKCEFIQSYRKIRFGYDGDCGATRLVDEMESQLTAAWPEELL